MENTNRFVLDTDIYEKYSEMKAGYGFRRALDGDTESVTYLPNSTIRLWINQEAVNYPIHWHTDIEMIVPIENGYTVIVGQTTYELNPGDIFIIPSGEVHHLIAPGHGTRLVLLFDINLLNKISGFSQLLSYFSQPVLINRDTCRPIYQESTEIINHMCRDYFCEDMLRDVSFYSRLLMFMTNYARFQHSKEVENTLNTSTKEHQKELMLKFNSVYDYINDHLSEDLTLEMVADVAGFSKFHFSRIFKEYSGYNYYDYLSFQRIKAAESLLLKPDMSVTEVALCSGFSSLTTFNRTFKKIKDCTPTEYRKLFNSAIHNN